MYIGFMANQLCRELKIDHFFQDFFGAEKGQELRVSAAAAQFR